MSKTSWLVKLEKCPYCNEDLNISSLSTRSHKDSISNVINLTKIHTDKCRKNKSKKLANIIVKTESINPVNSKIVTFKYEKIII